MKSVTALALLLVSSAALAQGSNMPPFPLGDIIGVSDTQFLGGWDSGYNFAGSGHNICPLDTDPCNPTGAYNFSKAITVPNGTSSAPGIKFSGSATSGVYYDTVAGAVKISGLSVPWSAVSATPTSASGFGITSVGWSLVTGTPTTRLGYGITDAMALSQTLAVTGDATATATTLNTGTIALTLSNSGVTAGTYDSSATTITPETFDAKGRLTGTGLPVTITPAFSSVTGKPTTLSGYGITDTLTATGDATGSAILSSDTIALTLASSGVTAGTYDTASTITAKTYDAKGRLTAIGAAQAMAPAWANITGKPTLAPVPLTGSISITGGSLVLGGCLTTVTATVTGATTSMVAIASPTADPGAYVLDAWVSSANTVSLRVCVGAAGTLTTQTWNIRVIQ